MDFFVKTFFWAGDARPAKNFFLQVHSIVFSTYISCYILNLFNIREKVEIGEEKTTYNLNAGYRAKVAK